MKVCKVKGCGKKHYGRGYCYRHYRQIKYHSKILKRSTHDPNEIIIKGDVAAMFLCDGNGEDVARAIIDAEDVNKIKKHKWHLSSKGYVITNIKSKKVSIQNFIKGLEPNKRTQIDHKDRNKLNNRKFNFRICTHAENNWNKPKAKNNISGFKGVTRSGKRWCAKIGHNKIYTYLGYFKNKKDAAIAYNKAAIKYHGEFACLNKIL